MYNILVYVKVPEKTIVIPDFKKYFDIISDELWKHLRYKNIKRFIRKNAKKSGVYIISVSETGLSLGSFSEQSNENLNATIEFTEDSIKLTYCVMDPMCKVLITVLEMGGLMLDKNKVDHVITASGLGIRNGQIVYSDTFGKTMSVEIEKGLKAFFIEDSFDNLFAIKF